MQEYCWLELNNFQVKKNNFKNKDGKKVGILQRKYLLRDYDDVSQFTSPACKICGVNFN